MSVEFISSKLLSPARHAFFNRRGGTSEGLFASLNCGLRSGDSPDLVAENRRRAAEVIGVGPECLLTQRQSHSARVAVVRQLPHDITREADGLVTALPGVAIGILTADCQPILLYDREAGVVAAIHAGWAGALGGIIENAIECMESLGATRPGIAAVVGPAISGANYEVGPEFRQRFLAEDPDSGCNFHRDSLGKLRFDLPSYGVDRLRRSGVQMTAWVGHCTYGDPEQFFSYRRSLHRREQSFGLLLSAIALP